MDKPCQAYEIFKQTLQKHMDEIATLNPIMGCVAGIKWEDAPLNKKQIDAQSEEEAKRRFRALVSFKRSAIVTSMAIFEGYVNDLFIEAFEHTDYENVLECERRWPQCKEIMLDLLHKCQGSKMYAIVQQRDVWSFMLKKMHRDEVLKDLSSRKPTMFHLRETFLRLFYKIDSKQPSKAKPEEIGKWWNLLVKNKSFRINWTYRRDCDPSRQGELARDLNPTPYDTKQVEIYIEDEDTISHILNMFYAIRCSIVHGKMQRTLEGVLKEFPQSSEMLKINAAEEEDGTEVANDIYSMYECLRREAAEDGGEMPVDYLMCVNMNRFMRTLAQNLVRVIGYYVYSELKHCEDYEYQRFWGLRMYNGIMDVPARKEDIRPTEHQTK